MENKKRTLQKMPPLKIGNVEMPNPLVRASVGGVPDAVCVLPLRYSPSDSFLIIVPILRPELKALR